MASGVYIPIWALVLLIIVLVVAIGAALFFALRDYLCSSKKKNKTATCSKPEASVKSTKSSSKKNKKRPRSKKSSKYSRSSKSSKSLKSLKALKSSAKDSKKEEKSCRSECSQSSKRSETEKSQPKSDVPLPKRDEKSLINEPVTPEEFRYYAQILAKMITDYYENVHKYPVTVEGKPGFIYSMLPKEAPMKPDDFDSIVKDINRIVIPGMNHWQSPQFHAYFTSGRSLVDCLAEFYIGVFGAVGFSWDSSPITTEMEHAMVNWLGRALGLPESFLFSDNPGQSPGGGSIYDGASEAVFTALMVARNDKISQLMGRPMVRNTSHGIHYELEDMHEVCKKFVCYTSKEAHSCVEKACKMAMVKCRAIAAREQNNWALTGGQVEKEIKKDIARGYVPIFMVATLGTTSTAALDDLPTIGPVCEKYNVWLHVDSAYGGSCWVVPELRHKCEAMEYATSVEMNPHKVLLHAVTATFMWTKKRQLFVDMYNINPPFLKPTHENVMDLRDWGILLSHKFKSLRTYMIMRLYGIEGMRAFIRRGIELAEYFEKLVASHENCRIFTRRSYTLFSFQYYEPDMSEHDASRASTALCRLFNSSRKVVFTHTKVGRNCVIRVSTGHERATMESIDESWRIMKEIIADFKKRKNELMSVIQMEPDEPVPPNELAEFDHIVGSENQHTDRTAVTPRMNFSQSTVDSSLPVSTPPPTPMNTAIDSTNISPILNTAVQASPAVNTPTTPVFKE